MENKFIIEDATPQFVIEDVNEDTPEVNPSTYGIKEEQPVQEKKEKGVVKKDANATPRKNTASKPVTTSSASQNQFSSREVSTPEWANVMDNTPPVKKQKSKYTKQDTINAVNTPIQTDFSALGGPSSKQFSFKEEGKTPEYKAAEKKKAAVEDLYKQADEAKQLERFRNARINHYKANNQWKKDEELAKKLNTVNEDEIEEEVADEKNTHQVGDYAMDALRVGGNILGGLLWTTPNNMLGKPFKEFEPYKIGDERKPFDAYEDRANEELKKQQAEAKKANKVWEEPSEEEKMALKERLFREDVRKRKIEENYNNMFSTGLTGGFSDYDKKMQDTQERLRINEINKIEGANNKQKINALKIHVKGSIADNLAKDILYDKELINSGKADDAILNDYNSKLQKYNDVWKDYTSTLEEQDKLEEDKLSAEESLKLYKLNYNTYSKMHKDLISPVEELLGGGTKIMGYIDPFAAGMAYVTGTENSWDKLSDRLMEAGEENRASQYQYTLENVNSISDFGGYFFQNAAGVLPYMLAPEGAVATGAFMTSAAGKKLYAMETEEASNPNIKYSGLQKASSMAINAITEGIMLGAVGKLMKGTKPVVGKIFNDPLKKEAFELGVSDQVKKVLNKFPKNYFAQVNHAGFTGATVSGINTLADNLILGKKADVTEAMVDGYANMAVVGAGLTTFPSVWGYGVGKLSETARTKAMLANKLEITKQEDLLLDPNLHHDSARVIKSKIKALKQENLDLFQKSVDQVGKFTKPQIKDLFDIDQEKIGIREQYKKIKESKDADSEGNKEALKDLERQWNEAENKKAKVFEKHNSLDYIGSKEELDALEVKAKQSLEQENANPNTPNVKISDESIKDRMTQMHLIESKMIDNYGVEDFNDLYERSFKELQSKVTEKQKEEGFSISDFDILQAAQKKAIDRSKFYNSLEGAYTPEGFKDIWDLSEKRKDLESSIKKATKEGLPTKQLRSELESTVNDILEKTNVGKEAASKMRKEWKNLTKIERQILAVKYLTKDDVRNGNFKDHIGENVAVQSFATTAEYQAAYNAYTDKMGLPRVDVSNVDAEFMDNGQILINTEVAKRTGQINAAGHELLHKVLKGAFAYRPEAIKAQLQARVQAGEITVAKAKNIIAKDMAIHDERMDDLVESFKMAMGKEARDIVQARIDKAYRYKTYSKKEFDRLEENGDPSIDDVIDVQDLGNGLVRAEISSTSYREEWITLFSDALARGQIKDGFLIKEDGAVKINWKKIGEALKVFTKKETDLDLEFKSGEDIVNFVKDYNKNLTKTRISSRAKGMIDAGIALGLNGNKSAKSKSIDDQIAKVEDDYMNNYIDFDQYQSRLDKLYAMEADNIVAERPISEKVQGEESVRLKKNITVDEQKLGKDIDNLVGEKDANGNYVMTKAQWDKGGIIKAKEKLIDGTILEPLIRKELTRNGVTTDNVHGVPMDIFFEDVKNRVLESALLKFDPERNNSLGGYIIGSQFGIKNRIGDIVNKYRKMLNTDSIDIEAGETGAMRELSSDDMADIAFDEVMEDAPKYKPLTESNIVKPEVIESVKDKTQRFLRTLKSKIEKPSQNVMVSPFVREIRDEIGKQVDIDLKTAMGGKKDNQLRDWALNAKKAFLENMTTTFLMGKDGVGGVPQAIQKRINGEWVSYPDWVGKTPDRESVNEDNAGRTAGHHMVRRLPDVANKISDEVYLSQLLDATGNPIRGRKESWATAIGQEMVFELINKDIKENGPIFETLVKNQELKDNFIADQAIADIISQLERGNTKYSNSGMDLIDSKLNTNDSKEVRLLRRQTREDYMRYIGSLDQDLFVASKLYLAGDKNVIFPDNVKEDLSKLRQNIIDAANIGLKNQKTKALGSKPQIEGSNVHEKHLVEVANEYKANKENGSINPAKIIQIVKAEAKAYKTSSGNLVTTNPQYVEHVLSRILNKENNPELFGDKGFKTVEKERINKDGSKEMVNSLYFYGVNINDYQVYSDGKGGLEMVVAPFENNTSRKTNLAFEKNPVKEAEIVNNINREAEANSQYIIDWAKNVKKDKNLSEAEVNGYLSMMMGDQESALSRSSKLGFYIKDVPAENTIIEHNTPKNVLQKAIKDFIFGNKTEAELVDLFSNSRINLVDRNMDNALSSEGLRTKGENRETNLLFIKNLAPYIESNKVVGLDRVYNMSELPDLVKAAKALPIKEIKQSEAYEKALTRRNLSVEEEPKGISVLDFDDTVGITKSNVLYTMPDGTKGKLNGAEFAKNGSRLLEEGAIFDFSEFSKVVEGKPGPLVEKMKKLVDKFGPDDVHILTARPADSAEPIHQFLSSIGIDIPLENIVGLGNSSPQAKADWMVGKVNEGYNDFYFVDDHLPNVEAVKNTLELFDVKSKVRQARAKFSKSMSEEFNKIIEENTGMESYKNFSDIVAKRRGHEANTFQFYVPPSAADFELLLYNFMGKGKRGEAHAKFFNEALLRPYSEGNDMMDAARQSIKNDYKKLNNAFPNVKAKLESLTPDKDFTYDQAVRVAMWKQEGVDIPGLSERDANKLADLVNTDPELKAFKEGLIITGRQGKGWVTPEKNWDANTIISDLHNLTEGAGRKKFLKEFIDNTEQLFGKWDEGKLVGPNMNKIEAVYGTNVREAIEDSVYRMTNGKNRSYGKDKETSAWSNWVNGSTGAIMFLNTRSAALQLLGSVNFLNLRDNNPIAAAKAFANQPQYWEDFSHIWNSAKIKERRGGLKDDVAAAEIANAAATAKGSSKPKAVLSYLLKIGYTPTQIADSFAIASGGAPYYRNRINSYLKEGMSKAEAEKMAWNDFTKVSDETQQSGDPRDISKQQASAAGRLLLTFQNTAMQQSRIIKKSYLDLKNGRGDAKTHVAKIGYYLAVQNAMFSALQTGLFAVMFSNDEEKDKIDKTTEKKMIDAADGILDTILRGAGFLGGTVATLKNMFFKYREESEKDFKADYAKVVMEGANISPPIGSKLRKVYSGLQQSKFDRDLIKERGWGIMQNGRVHLGPMYSVSGKVVEATTNIPMDRLVNKIENVSQAMNSQNQAWQRVAVGMGWSPYSVGITGSAEDLKIQERAKAERKEAGKLKTKETREAKKDSIANLSPEDYLKYMEKKNEKKQAKKDSLANLDPEDYLDYLEKQRSNRKSRLKQSTPGNYIIK